MTRHAIEVRGRHSSANFPCAKRGAVAGLKCHATFFYQYRNYTFDNSGRCNNVPYLAPPSEDINLK
jgi:hypothetical protein